MLPLAGCTGQVICNPAPTGATEDAAAMRPVPPFLGLDFSTHSTVGPDSYARDTVSERRHLISPWPGLAASARTPTSPYPA